MIPLDDPPLDVPTQPNASTPQPKPTQQPEPTQQPKPTEQPEPKPVDASIPDPFDNEEEYVGVDDEHMYMPTPPAQPTAHPHSQLTMSRMMVLIMLMLR